MKKNKKNFEYMSLAEMEAHVEAAERFRGVTLNAEKLRVYRDLESKLVTLESMSFHEMRVESVLPEPSSSVAVVILEMEAAVVFYDEEMDLFKECVALADGLVVLALDDMSQFRFTVQNIWEM